jgi:hypothetical protein
VVTAATGDDFVTGLVRGSARLPGVDRQARTLLERGYRTLCEIESSYLTDINIRYFQVPRVRSSAE